MPCCGASLITRPVSLRKNHVRLLACLTLWCLSLRKFADIMRGECRVNHFRPHDHHHSPSHESWRSCSTPLGFAPDVYGIKAYISEALLNDRLTKLFFAHVRILLSWLNAEMPVTRVRSTESRPPRANHPATYL